VHPGADRVRARWAMKAAELNLIRLDAAEWARGRMDTVAGRHRAALLVEVDRLRASHSELAEAARGVMGFWAERESAKLTVIEADELTELECRLIDALKETHT